MITYELMGKIAKDVFPHGAILTCAGKGIGVPGCDRSVEVTTDSCAAYLRIGWPLCCGVTAQVTAKETA